MSAPTLSVILPNYNHGHLLPNALQGLLDQPYPPTEIVVIDDGSTDNSVEIIESYARQHAHIRFYRNETNKGLLFTVNRALDLATGDFVFGTASDDRIHPGFVEKTMNLLARHPNAALCCTIGDWLEIETGWNWQVGVGMADNPCYISPSQMLALERRGGLHIATHNAVLRREPLLMAGTFLAALVWYWDWFAAYVT